MYIIFSRFRACYLEHITNLTFETLLWGTVQYSNKDKNIFLHKAQNMKLHSARKLHKHKLTLLT